MAKNSNSDNKTNLNRRKILSGTAALVSSASINTPFISNASPNKSPLKLGLIGCGGRGTGAANQALTADQDITLTTVADVSENNANGAISNLKKRHPEKVGDPKKFIGIDAYKKVIAESDVVILTTPPGFRPMMLREAVEAGKHVFCESQ